MARIILADSHKDFRGRIGDAVIYSWRGLVCMRCYAVPHNPDTPAQRIRRQLFAAGVECWKSLPPDIKARWNARKTGKRPTGYNLFMSEYMRLGYMPAIETPETVHICLMIDSWMLHTHSASFSEGKDTGNSLPFRPPDWRGMAA